MKEKFCDKQLDDIFELCKISQQEIREGRGMTVQEALEKLKENRKKVVDTK